jgi:hypothetical protein
VTIAAVSGSKADATSDWTESKTPSLLPSPLFGAWSSIVFGTPSPSSLLVVTTIELEELLELEKTCEDEFVGMFEELELEKIWLEAVELDVVIELELKIKLEIEAIEEFCPRLEILEINNETELEEIESSELEETWMEETVLEFIFELEELEPGQSGTNGMIIVHKSEAIEEVLEIELDVLLEFWLELENTVELELEEFETEELEINVEVDELELIPQSGTRGIIIAQESLELEEKLDELKLGMLLELILLEDESTEFELETKLELWVEGELTIEDGLKSTNDEL